MSNENDGERISSHFVHLYGYEKQKFQKSFYIFCDNLPIDFHQPKIYKVEDAFTDGIPLSVSQPSDKKISDIYNEFQSRIPRDTLRIIEYAHSFSLNYSRKFIFFNINLSDIISEQGYVIVMIDKNNNPAKIVSRQVLGSELIQNCFIELELSYQIGNHIEVMTGYKKFKTILFVIFVLIICFGFGALLLVGLFYLISYLRAKLIKKYIRNC